MSEKENQDVHRIERGPVHPAVDMAAQMAGQLHASRSSTINAVEFAGPFNSSAAKGRGAIA